MTEPPRLVETARTKTILALACLFVLTAGRWLAPAQVAEPVTEEKIVPLLEEQVERREPSRVFRGLQQAGNRAAVHSISIPRRMPPPSPTVADVGSLAPEERRFGFGLVVSPDEVLTHADALEGDATPLVVLPNGNEAQARAIAYEPSSGLVLLHVPAASLRPPALATEDPMPGQMALTAARLPNGNFVAPVFVASVLPEQYLLTAASGLPPGTPLFDADGRALGVSTGGPRARRLEPALSRLRRLGMPSTLGLVVQEIPSALAERLGRGALVAWVDPGGPAADAGVVAGDVLTEIGGTAIAAPEDLSVALGRLRAPMSVPLTVRRGEEAVTLQATPEVALRIPQISVPPELPSARASDVLRPEEIEAAGLAENTAVLSIDGVAATDPAALGRLRRRVRPETTWLVRVQDRSGPRYVAVPAGTGR